MLLYLLLGLFIYSEIHCSVCLWYLIHNLQVQYCAGTLHRCSSVDGGSSDGDAECEIATLAALSFGEERHIDRVTSRNEPSPAWKAASSRTLCVIIATTVIVTRANKRAAANTLRMLLLRAPNVRRRVYASTRWTYLYIYTHTRYALVSLLHKQVHARLETLTFCFEFVFCCWCVWLCGCEGRIEGSSMEKRIAKWKVISLFMVPTIHCVVSLNTCFVESAGTFT